MKSVFPDQVVRQVIDYLDPLDVLESLDFRSETILRDGNQLRMACPIHGETGAMRTLSVHDVFSTFRCTKADCPGNTGGDLIELVAMVRRTEYDTALRALVDEFELGIELPQNPEAITAALVEADNLLALMELEGADRMQLAGEVRARIERVLAESPDNLDALRLRIQLGNATDDARGLPELVMQVVDLERGRSNLVGALELLEEELGHRGDNLAVRRRFGDVLLATGATDRAFEQYLMVAESAEARGDLATALHAYRQIQAIGTTGLDVGSMITQLLFATDKSQEAVSELLKQAYAHREADNWDEAIAALAMATEAAPDDTSLLLKLIEWQGTRGLKPAEKRDALDRARRLAGHDACSDAAEILKVIAPHVAPDDEIAQLAARVAQATGDVEGIESLLLVEARRLAGADAPIDAMELARLVVSARPDHGGARETLATLCRSAGRFDEASEHWRALAALHEQADKGEEARAVLRAALDDNPADRPTLVALATSLARAGAQDDALAVLSGALGQFGLESRLADRRTIIDQALLLAPDDPEWRLAQAELLTRTGDRRGAARAVVAAARVHAARGDVSPAIEALRAVVVRDAPPPEAVLLLARWMADHGERPDALGLLRRHALDLARRGDSRAAAQMVDTALEWDDSDPALWEVQQNVARALGDRDMLWRAHEGLARSCRVQGRHAEAARYLRVLLGGAPGDLALREELRAMCLLAEDEDAWSTASIELADELVKREETKRARTILEEVVAERPGDLVAHERLVTLAFAGGADEDALQALDAYVAAGEGEGATARAAHVVRELSQAHRGVRALEERLLALLQKSRQTDEQADVLLEQAVRDEQEQRHEEAVKTLRRVEMLRPDDREVIERLAGVLVKSDAPREAASAWVRAADAARRTNDTDAANRAIRQALAIDRDCQDAWRWQARVAREGDQLEEARECLRTLAEIQVAAGEFGNAQSTAEELIALNPRDMAAHRLRVDALRRSPGATTTDLLDAYDHVARVHEEVGDFDAAFEMRREALRLTPRDEERREQLVKDLLRERHLADAVGVLIDTAEFERQEQNWDRATQCLDRALELDPDHLGTRALRAQVLEDSGRTEEALGEWRRLAPLLRGPATPRVEDAPQPATRPDLVVRDYTFDRFVVGDRNRFAWATGKAVAGAPGQTAHNPLFLHADVGLGKTHLLHAIANAVRTDNPELRICYTSAEDFTTDLIEAIQHNDLPRFRESYRAVEVLLIDDIHLLAGKERAQEEFFQVFNTLYQARRQIVVTSDRHPRDIAHLEKRLVSRFGAGVIVDIQEPEFETRLAILKRELEGRAGTEVPADVLALMAQNVASNVRELKGALNQLLLMHEVSGAEMSIETVREVLRRTTGMEVAG